MFDTFVVIVAKVLTVLGLTFLCIGTVWGIHVTAKRVWKEFRGDK